MKHHQTLRRGLSVLLALVLCLSLLPMTVLAEDAPVTSNFSARFDFGDGSNALARLTTGDMEGTPDTTKAEWDSTTKTLTLKGVNFTSTGSTAVDLPAGAKIVLAEGTTNTITSTNSYSSQSGSYGINAKGSLTIEGSGTLIVTGGAAEILSFGIYLDTGDLTINGGTVKATGGTSKMTYGIQTNGSATISGGTVTAIGGTSTVDGSGSYGIFAGGGLTINSGIVTATGSQATYSRGIGAPNGETVNITGGHVTAQTVSTTGEKSALNVEPDLSAYTGYKWRTSSVGAFTSSADKAYSHDNAYTYVEFSQGATVTTYTITFNANGGTGSMADVTGVSGSYTLPTCGFTAPEGKQFKGWATSENGEVISGTTITVTDNTTLYAIWEDISVTTYTVSFNANGGTLTGWTTTETEPDGTVDYLSAATREGYTFDGWYTEADGGEKVYTYVTVFTADTTVYAHWTPAADTKQITEAGFAMNGYAIGANAEDIVITSNTEGLSLVGGYFEAQGKPYSYLIAVVSGEDYDPVTGPLKANTEYILLLKADVNAGYDVSGLIKDHVTLNGDIEAEECVENKWEASIGCSFVLPVLTGNDNPDAKYTITFDANGGTGSMDAVTGVSGSYTLPTCTFTAPEGKQFKGWATSASGEVISGTSITVNGDTTLYAIWEDIPAATEYSITVTDGKATVGAGTEISKAAEGTAVTLTANAVPDGKVFDKWIVESGSITLADENSATTTFTMPASAVSVKATYKDAPHTHSYGSEWKSDADKHWHECSCGAKSEEAAHTASDWITDTAATATTDGTKHKECTVCGYVMETGTIPATGGDGHSHSYGSEWESDADNHWHECSCGDKSDVAAHSFKWVVDKEATATKKGSKHEECKVCGYQRPAVEIPATGSTTKPNTGALDDVPKTGDNSNMILWIVLLLASGFGVTGAVVYSKRKKYAK